MGTHPLNLATRFILEIAAFLSVGVWGWRQSDGWLRFLLACGIPIVTAAIWGTFTVPNDPSRSGKAPIPVPGILRLLMELAIFAFAAWALFDLGFTIPGWILSSVVAAHYLASSDRIRWLIRQ